MTLQLCFAGERALVFAVLPVAAPLFWRGWVVGSAEDVVRTGRLDWI